MNAQTGFSRKILPIGIILAVIAAPTALIAKQAVDQATGAAASSKMMKLSQEGFGVLRSVRGARLAIFNGQTDKAKTLVDNALKGIKKAQKDAKSFEKTDKGGQDKAGNPVDWIPVDGQLAVSDNFVATAPKKGHIAKANEHFKKGEKQKALEQLKLAEIDVYYSRLLMPVQITEDHIAAAQTLLNQKKFYEANLALKAAEDGTLVDSVALFETPQPQNAAVSKAGKAGNTVKQVGAKTAPAAKTSGKDS